MKRNLSVLTSGDYKGIDHWIKVPPTTKKGFCPFGTFGGDGNYLKCKAIFPTLGVLVFSHCGCFCPCRRFDLKYVTRVARKILNEYQSRKTQ